MDNISLIIPTYNEKENILSLIEKIKSINLNNVEIIIVDDNSPDKTWKIVKKNNFKNVHVLRRINKKGLSSAVIDGFKHSKSNIIGVMDADHSHPPELIPKLINPLINNKADLVIASRIIKGGRVTKWPIHRKMISNMGRTLAIPLTKVKDTMSGFFFIKRKVIDNVNLDPIGYKILLEILVKGNYDRNNFVEIPYKFSDRLYGKTKLNNKVQLQYLLHIYKLYKYIISKKLGYKKSGLN